jgi:hypothetical protein
VHRLAACLLALANGAALADWTAVGRPDEIYAAYADPASIRRSDGGVTMIGLYDFRRQDFTPEGRGLRSTLVLREYDCPGRRVRLLSSVDFAGQMGAGEAVSTSARQGRWEPVHAAGIDDAYLRVACATK